MFDFNTIIDRFGTNSIKYDLPILQGKNKDIISMSIADMDFKVPPLVEKRLKEAVDHGIFAYNYLSEDYLNAIKKWFLDRFNFEIKNEWVVTTPGIVSAICLAVQLFTKEGDSILIQQPVYNPFSNAIVINNRKLVNNPLYIEDNKYYIDFEDFERKIVDEDVKMFILCSPHNPVGRVWTLKELEKMGDICLKHNVLVLSDEIHCDFIDPHLGRNHVIFSSIKEAYLENSIICTAPSKTFNIAGLQTSNIFIPNEALRTKFVDGKSKLGLGSAPNILGAVACQAAYEDGSLWIDELNEYLHETRTYIDNYLTNHIPKITMIKTEGLFLLWLDFRQLGMNSEELMQFLENDAKLLLNEGFRYGAEGDGFIRMNIGCSIEVIKKVMEQLKVAVDSL